MRKAIQFLGALDDVDVEWMSRAGSTVQVRRAETLIEEGKPIDAIYLVLDGELSVTVAGARAPIAKLLAGEIVGEMSFVDARPPVASVSAERDTYVLALPRDAVRTKLTNDVGFAARFYRAIACFLADRLYVTVGRFGYGSHRQDVDVDELVGDSIDELSLGALRFDDLIKRTRRAHRAQTV